MCHFGTTGKEEEEKRHSAVGRRRRGKKKEKRRNSIAVGASLPSGRVPSFFPEIKRGKKRRSAAEILFLHNSRDMLLQKVDADGLLVVPGEDALAVALDHAGLADGAVADDHHLQETE